MSWIVFCKSVACATTCAVCRSATDCSLCTIGYFLQQSTCQLCPAGTYGANGYCAGWSFKKLSTQKLLSVKYKLVYMYAVMQ